MERLIQGVREFQSQIVALQPDFFSHLADGQQPEAMLITCSDSRVDPCLLTQSPPGRLFVLRNSGNVVPPSSASPGGEAAAIEFAVEVLAVPDIVVCGHSHCGTMQCLVSPETLRGLPNVSHWLRYVETTRRIVTDKLRALPPDERLARAVEENVLVQLDNLRTHAAVSRAILRGDLNLHGWVYHIETGRVVQYDAVAGGFVPLDRP